MKSFIRCSLWVCFLGALLAGPAGGGVELSIEGPTSAAEGTTITLDVFLSSDQAISVYSYQTTMPCALNPVDDATGTVTYLQPTCNGGASDGESCHFDWGCGLCTDGNVGGLCDAADDCDVCMDGPNVGESCLTDEHCGVCTEGDLEDACSSDTDCRICIGGPNANQRCGYQPDPQAFCDPGVCSDGACDAGTCNLDSGVCDAWPCANLDSADVDTYREDYVFAPCVEGECPGPYCGCNLWAVVDSGDCYRAPVSCTRCEGDEDCTPPHTCDLTVHECTDNAVCDNWKECIGDPGFCEPTEDSPRILGAPMSSSHAVVMGGPDSDPQYLGTFVFQVSEGAEGFFEIILPSTGNRVTDENHDDYEWTPVPYTIQIGVCGSDVDCVEFPPPGCWACEPENPAANDFGCVYHTRFYGDMYPVPDGDGAAEGFDILCVLDAANDLNTFGCLDVLPTGLMAGDIYPCGTGDSAVEGFDILAVLDAANDIYWCAHPCPPP